MFCLNDFLLDRMLGQIQQPYRTPSPSRPGGMEGNFVGIHPPWKFGRIDTVPKIANYLKGDTFFKKKKPMIFFGVSIRSFFGNFEGV